MLFSSSFRLFFCFSVFYFEDGGGGGSEGRSLLFIFSLSSLVEDFAIYDNGEAMKKNLIFCHES